MDNEQQNKNPKQFINRIVFNIPQVNCQVVVNVTAFAGQGTLTPPTQGEHLITNAIRDVLMTDAFQQGLQKELSTLANKIVVPQHAQPIN